MVFCFPFSYLSCLLLLWSFSVFFFFFLSYGHSQEITQCIISPDQQTIITTGAEGAIFIWGMPQTAPKQNIANGDYNEEGLKDLSIDQKENQSYQNTTNYPYATLPTATTQAYNRQNGVGNISQRSNATSNANGNTVGSSRGNTLRSSGANIIGRR